MARKKAREAVFPGARFGRWTVTGSCRTDEKGQRRWACTCDCGTQREVLERSLIYGGSESCGCLRRQRTSDAVFKDLTGKQFGELHVIRRLDSDKRGAARWLCRCSCGKEYEATSSALVTGKRTHCADKVHRKNTYIDIAGKTFGRLTAIEPLGRSDAHGSVMWLCRCSCGAQIEASYNSLMYTNLKSCGCQKKEHDQKLHSYLTHVAGTSVDILKSKKVPSDNTTGHKGVYLIRGKYVAKIVFQKKAYYLGAFDAIEPAIEARRAAEEILFDGAAAYYEKWLACAQHDPIWAQENPIRILVNQHDAGKLDVAFLPKLFDISGT